MLRYLSILIVFTLFQINTFSQSVKIHYLGHSAFVINFDDITLVNDYGKPNAWKQWGWDSPIHNIGNLVPDIMTYSHLHEDHYDASRIPQGVKHILKNGESLEFKGLKISPIKVCEDNFGNYDNTSYVFTYKGLTIVHTGDIQGMIADIENESVAQYFKSNYPKNIDLLIMPIEGKIKYIQQAEKFIQVLNPQNVIPSHAWSQEYLNEFISYINSKNKYKLQVFDNPIYKLSSSPKKDLNQIIILKRSKYLDN